MGEPKPAVGDQHVRGIGVKMNDELVETGGGLGMRAPPAACPGRPIQTVCTNSTIASKRIGKQELVLSMRADVAEYKQIAIGCLGELREIQPCRRRRPCSQAGPAGRGRREPGAMREARHEVGRAPRCTDDHGEWPLRPCLRGYWHIAIRQG